MCPLVGRITLTVICNATFDFKCINLIVRGPESEIIPPGGIFVDPHIFVVSTLAFKNLVVGWKIDAGCGHNKLVSLATHAIF